MKVYRFKQLIIRLRDFRITSENPGSKSKKKSNYDRRSARLMAAAIFLAVTYSSASAATISTFSSNCGSVPSPVASPGSHAFPVNLPATFLGITCAIDFNYPSGISPATTYNFAVTITNNTGEVMTDLEIPLYTGIGDTFVLSSPPAGSGTPVSSPDLPYVPGSSTSTYLVFVGPPNLPLGGTDTVDFSITTPTSPNLGGGAFDSIQIIPTFTPASSVPEPSTVGLTTAGLLMLAALLGARRKRRVTSA
jgi:hypothetical protein